MARSSIENVITVLRTMGMEESEYDIHVNFPGGIPIDGPSAGIAMATGIYSAIYNVPIKHTIAMTGEIGLHGKVKPIGGVVAKVKAAKQAGVETVIIPKENMNSLLEEIKGIEIIPVTHIKEVLALTLVKTAHPLLNREEDVSLPKRESM
jgi:Lon-like ATP-dependent protease